MSMLGPLTAGRALSSLAYSTSTDGSLNAPSSLMTHREVESMINEAATSCNNQRGRPDNDLWEAIAEADKSLMMLHDLFRSGKKLLTTSHNGAKLLDLGKAKAVGSVYLLWRYGLMPLMNDIAGVQKGLVKQIGVIRQTARGKSQLSSYSVVPSYNQNAFGALLYDRMSAITDSYSCHAMSLDEMKMNTAFNIGLSTKGLVTLPWELISYSFVLDWFVNVGDFLGAIVPLFGVNQLGSCYVVRRVFEQQVSTENWRPISSDWTFESYPDTCGATLRYTSSQRVVGLPAPKLVIKADFRFSNMTRCLDAFALLLQRVKTSH